MFLLFPTSRSDDRPSDREANRFTLYGLALIALIAVGLPALGALAPGEANRQLAAEPSAPVIPAKDLAPPPLPELDRPA